MKLYTTIARAAALAVAAVPAAAAPFIGIDQRVAAATATAGSHTNACQPIRPFHWQVGNRDAALASGSVARVGDPAPTAATPMSIASASKWLYAAYVLQRKVGPPSAADVRFLTLRSGYVSFDNCLPWQSIDGCLDHADNGQYTPSALGHFHYGGGHMQKHASLVGLGALDNDGLAAEMQTQLGADIGLGYSVPQPAGGAVTSANDYARFLRKLLDGKLRLGERLGSDAICAHASCKKVSTTPIPSEEHWKYSLGHWVESDPIVGDGAFSSAGSFGFYPWIDAKRRWYGIVARQAAAGSAHDSVQCGRLIRKAWLTGTAQ